MLRAGGVARRALPLLRVPSPRAGAWVARPHSSARAGAPSSSSAGSGGAGGGAGGGGAGGAGAADGARSSFLLWAARAALAAPVAAAGLIAGGMYYGKAYREADAGRFKMLEVDLRVPSAEWARLTDEAVRLATALAARYDYPGGKKGRTLSYAALRDVAPGVVAFYAANAAVVGRALGLPLVLTPPSDKSSCSILLYEADGDFIDWHYDVNWYAGRHFTVLVPLLVEPGADAQLQAVVPPGAAVARLPGGPPAPPAARSASVSQALLRPWAADASNAFPGGARVQAVPTPANGRAVVFEGNYVFHRVVPARDVAAAAREAAGGAVGAPAAPAPPAPPAPPAAPGAAGPRRVVLSMTYTTDATITPVMEATRRLKDMAYFGPLSVFA